MSVSVTGEPELSRHTGSIEGTCSRTCSPGVGLENPPNSLELSVHPDRVCRAERINTLLRYGRSDYVGIQKNLSPQDPSSTEKTNDNEDYLLAKPLGQC